MGSSFFSIGISGLHTAQTGLLTTSHNIANVNTPNYTRQEVLQSNNPGQFSGAGFVGQGVKVETVRRIYNENLQTQIQQAQAGSSRLDAYYQQIAQIDNLLADPTAGLSPALNDFFSGVQNVAAHPEDASSRQVLLSAAQSLASRFTSLDDRLARMRDGVNTQILASVGQINSYAKQIAALNERIVLANADAGGGQVPNDLLDQRDGLILQLNEQIGATVVKQPDGGVDVFIGTGQALVSGSKTIPLTTTTDAQDPSNLQIALQTSTATVRFPTGMLQGGVLSGLYDFRDQTLNPAQNALGRAAMALANAFNAQHATGQDATGALGGAFFSSGAPQVIGAAGNSAGAAVSATVASHSQLTTSDYRLQYDGANYTITRLSDNATQTFAAMPQTVDGVAFTVASPLASGDSFLVQPTRTAARDFSVAITDARQIAAAAPVRVALGATNTGSAKVVISVDQNPPAAATLQQPISVRFDVTAGVTTYDLIDTASGTAISTGNAYTAGAPIAHNGWRLNVTGSPADNDQFNVGPNTNGIGDNRNALLLASVQTQGLVGGLTLQGVYGQMVAAVGSKTHELDVTSQAQAKLLSQAKEARESLSGVNLDEEAANLLRYQQAYQAAAKSIAMAGTMFDTVLGLFN